MKKITCEFCGEKFNDADQRCPHCGGPNRLASKAQTEAAMKEGKALPALADSERHGKHGAGRPKTIEELRTFAVKHNLPLEKMRVHLGEDYREPKAFGIYQAEDGSFVVYKNKADGSRAIRYQGRDEAYAVNELYLKMREQVGQQRSYQAALLGQTRSAEKKSVSWKTKLWAKVWIILLVSVICFWIWGSIRRSGPTRGYYCYNDDYYYFQGGNWYYYDNGWLPVIADSTLTSNYDEYYASSAFNREYGVTDFINSGYYDPNINQNNHVLNDDNDNDDDDWDWGGDEWDDIGDWDSDW